MFDDFFTNIGAKIKKCAQSIFAVETISAIIGGLILLSKSGAIGLVVLIGGPIAAWISSAVLYAFGELVEDVHAIRDKEGTTAEVRAKLEAEEMEKRKEEERAKREAEQLSIADIESAASAFLKRRVSISDINCTLLYVIPKSTGKPKEMHLDMSVGDTEFTSLDLFFDQQRKSYFFKDRQLALDSARRSAEEIFGFDVSLFKEFSTEVDDDE
jgi:hypothetical protein